MEEDCPRSGLGEAIAAELRGAQVQVRHLRESVDQRGAALGQLTRRVCGTEDALDGLDRIMAAVERTVGKVVSESCLQEEKYQDLLAEKVAMEEENQRLQTCLSNLLQKRAVSLYSDLTEEDIAGIRCITDDLRERVKDRNTQIDLGRERLQTLTKFKQEELMGLKQDLQRCLADYKPILSHQDQLDELRISTIKDWIKDHAEDEELAIKVIDSIRLEQKQRRLSMQVPVLEMEVRLSELDVEKSLREKTEAMQELYQTRTRAPTLSIDNQQAKKDDKEEWKEIGLRPCQPHKDLTQLVHPKMGFPEDAAVSDSENDDIAVTGTDLVFHEAGIKLHRCPKELNVSVHFGCTHDLETEGDVCEASLDISKPKDLAPKLEEDVWRVDSLTSLPFEIEESDDDGIEVIERQPAMLNSKYVSSVGRYASSNRGVSNLKDYGRVDFRSASPTTPVPQIRSRELLEPGQGGDAVETGELLASGGQRSRTDADLEGKTCAGQVEFSGDAKIRQDPSIPLSEITDGLGQGEWPSPRDRSPLRLAGTRRSAAVPDRLPLVPEAPDMGVEVKAEQGAAEGDVSVENVLKAALDHLAASPEGESGESADVLQSFDQMAGLVDSQEGSDTNLAEVTEAVTSLGMCEERYSEVVNESQHFKVLEA